jgi:hypothetical protein
VLLASREVPESQDLDRVLALPIRLISGKVQNPSLLACVNDYVRTPTGTMSLRPIQSAALAELVENNGLFGAIGVGAGKSLITLLAATVLDGVKRPVLFVPAQLRDQTNRILPGLTANFKIRNDLKIVGYSEVSTNPDLLDTLDPDLLILDECHYLKDPKSARTRRFIRYLANNEERVRVVAVSGTVTSRSIMDYWHILLWALRYGAPLPIDDRQAQLWADALDVKPDNPARPGALYKLGRNVREGYQTRLLATPGVVVTKEAGVRASLQLHMWRPPIPETIKQALKDLQDTWQLPDGNAISEDVELFRHLRTLSNGFYYRWTEQPPIDWLFARSCWKALVREFLRTTDKADTELQARQMLAHTPELKEWERVKDSFSPVTEPVWISDMILIETSKLLSQQDLPTLVWIKSRALGHKLAKALGVPYFGEGENDHKNILTQEGHCVLSVAAHGTGKNLQTFSNNIFVEPMRGGLYWEQAIGRTHRPGQLADEVRAYVNVVTKVLLDTFNAAKKDAAYQQETLGVPQRILFADVVDM